MTKRDRTIRFFDERAHDWEKRHTPPSPERLDEVVALANLAAESTVVDIGCGVGVLIPALLGAMGDSGRIVAVDPAPRMIEGLCARHPDPRIETRVETLEENTIPQESADAIICFSCFPHMHDQQQAIASAARILKPGGRLVIAHFSSRAEINDFHTTAHAEVSAHTLPDRAEMEQMIRNAGLAPTHFIDEPGRYEIVAIKR